MDEKTNILIAVMSYRNLVHPQCMTSLMDAGRTLSLNKVQYRISTAERSNSALAYDLYASLVVQDATFSHVMFVDGDVQFGPNILLRLLQLDKSIIGAACPYRQLEPRFAVTFQKRREIPVTGGLVEVDGVGMSATLIQRGVFETMVAKAAVLAPKVSPATAKVLTGPLYNFFHPICTRERRLTEDASFCARWREQCRGQIFALIDEEVSHHGPHEFKGRLSDHLTVKGPAGQTAQPARK
jgi:hypothetical protein